MHLRIEPVIALTAVAVWAMPVSAQEAAEPVEEPPAWSQPLEGFERPMFGEKKGLGVMLVTPTDDEPSTAVVDLLRREVVASGLAEVVMDDAPLGDVSAKSDDEIIDAARKYPVDVIVIVRSFPGAEGPTAVMRIETIGEGTVSFRLRPGGPPPWATKPQSSEPAEPVEEQRRAAEERASESGRAAAAFVRMGAVGVGETLRLIAAENDRKQFSFEQSGAFGWIVDTTGDRVAWPEAYRAIGHPDWAKSYQRRKNIKTAALVGGGLFAAAGTGLLFVGLANQANCSGGASGCERPGLIGGGALMLTTGLVGLTVGALVRPHPATVEDVVDGVERYNRALTPSH